MNHVLPFIKRVCNEYFSWRLNFELRTLSLDFKSWKINLEEIYERPLRSKLLYCLVKTCRLIGLFLPENFQCSLALSNR